MTMYVVNVTKFGNELVELYKLKMIVDLFVHIRVKFKIEHKLNISCTTARKHILRFGASGTFHCIVN